eukprot:91993-Chlamydomonas_euryale.AAC.4
MQQPCQCLQQSKAANNARGVLPKVSPDMGRHLARWKQAQVPPSECRTTNKALQLMQPAASGQHRLSLCPHRTSRKVA